MEDAAPTVIPGDPTPEESFPSQWNYVTSEWIRNVSCCSRRTGKTRGEILRARRFLVRQKKVLYVGKVLKNVRNQFWFPLKDSLARHGIEFKSTEPDVVLRTPEGGMVMGMSADDVKDIEKGRGYDWDLVLIDEGQSMADEVIEPLVDYILIPTLIDRGGTLDLNGTPPRPDKGDALTGYFVRTVRQAALAGASPRQGWRLHHWTVFDNPFIDPARVYEAYSARGIGPGHPIWEAEVMGRLVTNAAHLVLPLDAAKNGYEALP